VKKGIHEDGNQRILNISSKLNFLGYTCPMKLILIALFFTSCASKKIITFEDVPKDHRIIIGEIHGSNPDIDLANTYFTYSLDKLGKMAALNNDTHKKPVIDIDSQIFWFSVPAKTKEINIQSFQLAHKSNNQKIKIFCNKEILGKVVIQNSETHPLYIGNIHFKTSEYNAGTSPLGAKFMYPKMDQVKVNSDSTKAKEYLQIKNVEINNLEDNILNLNNCTYDNKTDADGVSL
jgi:hypothetical protein